jgi:hypothetical protein
MLVPLAFIVLLHAARMHSLLNTLIHKITSGLLKFFLIAVGLVSVLLPVIFSKKLPVSYLHLKIAVLVAGLALIFVFRRNNQSQYGLFYNIVMALLIARISFNLFLLPYRQSQSWVSLCRSDAIKLGKATAGEKMFVLADTITMHNVYYLTRERNEILRYSRFPEPGNWYIFDDTVKYQNYFHKEFTMKVPYHYKTYFAAKYKDQP